MSKKVKKVAAALMRNHTIINDSDILSMGIGKPYVFHALVVIFLEYFAWGLLMTPLLSNLFRLYPGQTLFMNGIIMGIKGFLSFLSAPLIGALSDVWGRKFFLIITVFVTCLPIPLLAINAWWCFALISLSGIFSVTFSIVFAYVADITEERDRSAAYGMVSASFAAGFVLSPALGTYLLENYSENFVVTVSTAIAVFDVLFVLIAVPESLPQRISPSYYKTQLSWERADPFALLRKVGIDQTVLLICVTVIFSFIPEAGVYSCLFVYVRYVLGFSMIRVTLYSAFLGGLAVSFQCLIGMLMNVIGPKKTILLGLSCEFIHLLCFGFAYYDWMIWIAGILASFSTITYPAISVYVSVHSDGDKQGLLQGIVMGVRSLCNGIGPALFGLFFYLSDVDLNYLEMSHRKGNPENVIVRSNALKANPIKGQAFLFGSLLAFFALICASFIPHSVKRHAIHGYTSTTNLTVDVNNDSWHKKNENASSPVLL